MLYDQSDLLESVLCRETGIQTEVQTYIRGVHCYSIRTVTFHFPCIHATMHACMFVIPVYLLQTTNDALLSIS